MRCSGSALRTDHVYSPSFAASCADDSSANSRTMLCITGDLSVCESVHVLVGVVIVGCFRSSCSVDRPSSRHRSLSFRCVLPPRRLRLPFHVSNCGNEHVQHARIVALAGQAAQLIVHRVGVTSEQIGGPGDSQLREIGSDGGTDVGNLFETDDIGPGLRGRCSFRFLHRLIVRRLLADC